jgi:hypothetical protein
VEGRVTKARLVLRASDPLPEEPLERGETSTATLPPREADDDRPADVVDVERSDRDVKVQEGEAGEVPALARAGF